ncbi:helix-turn-helix domain-containing protein [Clostridium sp. CF012]|uniref:helix-turn-helix domain-containing protein n=1 Tax=Clostridium sp. CF012 TaxID=2843319 RepID=UPI001C0C707F|nr:helix-turn-helix domain-containing protein [Clostridium sp. CF012]MBU3144358.1 AraC family transcriptional regulator [Clostridium sp. CF012]
MEKSYVAMMKELSNSMDIKIKDVSNLCVQLSYTPWVKKMMYTESPSFDNSRMGKIELNNHVLELKGYDVSNNFINTIALIFPKQEFVISSAGTQNAETFFDDSYTLENYEYVQWKHLFNSYGIKEIFTASNLTVNGKKEKVFSYVQSLPSIDQKPHGFFLSYIKEKEMNDRLKGFQISNDSSIYVLNQYGNLVTSLNSEKNILSDIENVKLSKDMNKLQDILKINGKKYLVFYHISPVNQWKYITIIPYSIAMVDINRIKIATILIAILLSLIGLGLSYLFTNYNYKPVENLVNIMKGRFCDKETECSSEYDFLSKSIYLLLSEEDLLRKKSEQQMPFLRNSALLQHLSGNVNGEKSSAELMRSLEIEFPFENYIVVLVVLENVKGLHSGLSIRVAEQMKSFEAKVHLVEVNSTKKVAIVNMKNLQKIKESTLLLKKIMEEELFTKCSMGVGKPYNSIKHVKFSYEEACNAMEYRLTNDKSDIIFYEEISKISTTYYYPIDKELEILNAIRRGKYIETRKVIEEIISKNVQGNNMYLNNGRCLFYDLIGTALKALNDLKFDTLVTIDEKHIMKVETLAELQEYLNELCEKICDEISENKTSHNEILKINILKYIEENCNNPSISLYALAESVNKSVPYISKFFKEQIGSNFLDYLNRKKIAKAKELLTGQMTILQISVLVGYNSDVTFRRVFKKYEGITPSEYIISK